MDIYTEKEILGDALATQKMTTANFNTYANECVHEDVRQLLLRIQQEEHDLAQEVFCMMHEKGFYPVPEAEGTKVAQTKQQFAKAAGK